MAKEQSDGSEQREALSEGPLVIERYGRRIVFRSDWQKGQREDLINNLAQKHPKVTKEIDLLVLDIAGMVSNLPPDELLKRAWWLMSTSHKGKESEIEFGEEEVLSQRMLDYVQSMIAAVRPRKNKAKGLSQEDWDDLVTKVKRLFRKLNYEYGICTRAKNFVENPEADQEYQQFYFQAQFFWCNVRGHRYHIHEPTYLVEMFSPHDQVFRETFGISSQHFIDEIVKIWRSLSFGLADLNRDIFLYGSEPVRVSPELSHANEALAPILRPTRDDRKTAIVQRLFGFALFDLDKIANLPRRLLEELSWEPGQEKQFLAEGKFRGWPLRIWPIFKRPFIKLNGRFYCFDHYSLFDHLYRAVQRTVLRMQPRYKETWNKIQNRQSEELPLKYLQLLLPGAEIMRQVNYRGETGKGRTDWCETDSLLIYDDHLLIIEARGGAFTYTPPATDFPAYIESLKNLLWKPATQGQRFLRYLESADSVQLFNKHHESIGEISRSDFRHITICPITIDSFTELAAQAQHLRKIGVDVRDKPVWPISLDDLRVYADVFDNPLMFLHFVEQRVSAFRSERIQILDEIDHLGLYISHNDYSTYLKEEKEDINVNSPVGTIGYRSHIDKFFTERMHDPNIICPVRQQMPERFREILDFLAQSKRKGRAAVASYLLDAESHSRTKIHSKISQSIHRRTIETVVPMDNARQYLLLKLRYSVKEQLNDLDWRWI